MSFVKDNIWKAEIPLIGATHIIFDDGKKKDMIKQRILHYLTIMFIIMILIVVKYLKAF